MFCGPPDTRTVGMVAHFAHFLPSPEVPCQATPLMLICGYTLWLFASVAQPKPELLNCSLTVVLFSIYSNVYFDFSVPAMAAGVTILTDLPHTLSDSQRREISAEMETGKWALYHKSKIGVPCSVVCVALTLSSNVNLYKPIQIFYADLFEHYTQWTIILFTQ